MNAARWGSTTVAKVGLIGVGVRLLIMALNLSVSLILAYMLVPSLFGTYSVLLSFGLLVAVADLGVGQTLLTRFASIPNCERELQRRLLCNALVLCSLATTALLVPLTAVAFLVPWQRVLGSSADHLEASVLILFILTLANVPFSLSQRVHQARLAPIASNAYVLLGVVVSSILLLQLAVMGADLPALIAATYVGPLGASILQTWRLYAQESDLRPKRGLVDRRTQRDLIRSSALFLTLNVCAGIAYGMDSLIVANRIGSESAGALALSLKLFGIVTQLNAAFVLVIWPAIASASARRDRVAAWGLTVHCVKWVSAVAIPATIVICIVARPLMRGLYADELIPSPGLILALGVWTAQSAAMSPIAMLLNATDVLRFQIVTSALMAVSNLLCSLALVDILGISGVIWGSAASHLVFIILPSLYYVRKKYGNIAYAENSSINRSMASTKASFE